MAAPGALRPHEPSPESSAPARQIVSPATRRAFPAAARPARMSLENDPDNPCFGCGPANADGLRLAFERGAQGARTRLDATREREGWPQRLHSGLLYLAMLETANWTVFALRGRVGLPVRTSALDARRWVATGETLEIEGRAVEAQDAALAVEVTARGADGALAAMLTRAYALPRRGELARRLGYDALPEALLALVPE